MKDLKSSLINYADSLQKQSKDKQNLVSGHRYLCKTKDDVFYAWFDEFDDCFVREDGTTCGAVSVKWEYFLNADCTKEQLKFESWLNKFKVSADTVKTQNLAYINIDTTRLYSAWRDLSGLAPQDTHLLMLANNLDPEIYRKHSKYKGD